MITADLIKKTQTYVDEAAPNAQVGISLSPDKKPLSEQLGLCLTDAFRQLYTDINPQRVKCDSFETDENDKIEDGAFKIVIEEDFIRLKCVKLASWKREITEVSEVNSAVYKKQMNPYTRAKQDKPVVIRSSVEDNTILHLYSPIDGDTVERLEIIWNWGIESVQDDLIPALCWQAAIQYFSIIGGDTAYAIEMYKKQLL